MVIRPSHRYFDKFYYSDRLQNIIKYEGWHKSNPNLSSTYNVLVVTSFATRWIHIEPEWVASLTARKARVKAFSCIANAYKEQSYTFVFKFWKEFNNLRRSTPLQTIFNYSNRRKHRENVVRINEVRLPTTDVPSGEIIRVVWKHHRVYLIRGFEREEFLWTLCQDFPTRIKS